MMYSNKFASAIQVGGKILREFKDSVYIPFGSEYSIVLKNLNTVRALVTVTIDGKTAIEDLVVPADSQVILERFFNGNVHTGNKFKFIERTSKIEQGPRGIRVEDGLIQIKYKFEKPRPPAPAWPGPTFKVENPFNSTPWNGHPDRYFGQPPIMGYASKYDGDTGTIIGQVSADAGYHEGMASMSFTDSYEAPSAAMNVSASIDTQLYSRTLRSSPSRLVASSASIKTKGATREFDAPVNDVGITVPGSQSSQSFRVVENFETEAEVHSMVIKLLGQTENAPVTAPVTVKTQIKCTTCGHQNKAKNKFCSECGTSLQLF